MKRGLVLALTAASLVAGCANPQPGYVSYADAIACIDGYTAIKAKPNISNLRVEDLGDGTIRCVAGKAEAEIAVVVDRVRPRAERDKPN